jgi:probable HAF family extracellular repeat protein
MHRTSLALTSALVATGLLSAAAPLRADVRYAITDLGTLGGRNSTPTAINNLGQVVGYSATTTDAVPPTHAFLFSGGTMTDLGTLGGTTSRAYDINDGGQIVGTAVGDDTPEHAFIYRDGSMHDLDAPNRSRSSYASGINNSGQIVGAYDTGQYIDGINYFVQNAFTVTNGVMSNLGTFGSISSQATTINNSGQIAGTLVNPDTDELQGFVRNSDGTSTVFDQTSIYSVSHINDLGQVVGEKSSIPFLWDNGSMTYLATLGGPDNSSASANSINNAGQVVGQSTIDGSLYSHAFLYTSADGTIDLNSLIDPSSGWTLTFATDINDAGLIVGQGTNPAGQRHAFLLTPTPEPASLSLLALAATPLLSPRRR